MLCWSVCLVEVGRPTPAPLALDPPQQGLLCSRLIQSRLAQPFKMFFAVCQQYFCYFCLFLFAYFFHPTRQPGVGLPNARLWADCCNSESRWRTEVVSGCMLLARVHAAAGPRAQRHKEHIIFFQSVVKFPPSIGARVPQAVSRSAPRLANMEK